jgi:hypothetical protein
MKSLNRPETLAATGTKQLQSATNYVMQAD